MKNTRTNNLLRRAWRAAALALLAATSLCMLSGATLADSLHLTDGKVIEVDETWEDAQGVWYRRGGITQWIERGRVRSVERAGVVGAVQVKPAAKPAEPSPMIVKDLSSQSVQIYFVGGARVEADEVTEAANGFWFRRGNITAFTERARIERVERDSAGAVATHMASVRGERTWTSGKPNLDALIRQSGAAHGVDPYLVFCVMEHESHFNPRAVSPAGARGLMQLMTGTARRFGVRKIFDPAQNVEGGARYLKELVGMFGGRLDLVLASYNAGEGAVIRYGQRVPPYAETRNYVRRISARYGSGEIAPATAKP